MSVHKITRLSLNNDNLFAYARKLHDAPIVLLHLTVEISHVVFNCSMWTPSKGIPLGYQVIDTVTNLHRKCYKMLRYIIMHYICEWIIFKPILYRRTPCICTDLNTKAPGLTPCLKPLSQVSLKNVIIYA